jgi:hypothetical protein
MLVLSSWLVTLSRPCLDSMLQCEKARWLRGGDLMTFELSVNGHSSRAASVAEFRLALIPFAFHEFREICINIDEGGSALVALGFDGGARGARNPLAL